MIRIAVDALGGDAGPGVIVDGALAAARELGAWLLLVGPSALLAGHLERHAAAGEVHAAIVPADDVVEMGETPAEALRRKPGATIRVAADLVGRGEADAMFSAGHTGATVVAACSRLGLLEGVARPALATTIPARHGATVVLDVGANARCRPAHLVQFAVMGSSYARVALGIEQPRIGLLSIGAEASKGNDLTRAAYQLLRQTALAFVGNVEAHQLYRGVADVIVCDGFTGNIVLKASEGMAEMVSDLLGNELAAAGNVPGTEGQEGSVARLKRTLDYAEYGGAPLLGVAGVAIVGHGRSNARAVRSAIVLAHRFAQEGIVQRIRQQIAAAGAVQS